jgi:hypothetical protein
MPNQGRDQGAEKLTPIGSAYKQELGWTGNLTQLRSEAVLPSRRIESALRAGSDASSRHCKEYRRALTARYEYRNALTAH